jgi:hypothetical protein
MTIVAIIRQADALYNETLEARIINKFPGNYFRVAKGQWLVNSVYGPEELCKELGIIPNGHYSNTLALEVSRYYGMYLSEMWDWIKNKSSGL